MLKNFQKFHPKIKKKKVNKLIEMMIKNKLPRILETDEKNKIIHTKINNLEEKKEKVKKFILKLETRSNTNLKVMLF